jgi:hypothetical protein
MSGQEPLFEVISDDEFAKAQETSLPADDKPKRGSKPKFNTDVRTRTNWFKFPTHSGFCTVPMHVEIQDALSDEEKQYRKGVETRMVFEIGPYMVCRDCFLAEADKESVTDDHGG